MSLKGDLEIALVNKDGRTIFASTMMTIILEGDDSIGFVIPIGNINDIDHLIINGTKVNLS